MSASEKVQEILADNNNIRKIIEETAQTKLYARLDYLLDKQIKEAEDILEEHILIVPQLISATDRIRVGSRPALVYLDSIRRHATRESVRDLAETMYDLKREDYYNAYSSRIDTALYVTMRMTAEKPLFPHPLLMEISDNYKEWQDPAKPKKILNKLVDIIRNDNDLNMVAIAFLIIDKWYGIELELFDFEEFDRKF